MLRIAHIWHLAKRNLASQSIARSNAAEASTILGRRREEQDAVDAYLEAQRLVRTPDATEARRGGGHGVEHVV